MSDHGSDVEKPTSPIEDLPDPPPKQKRQMSEKQLANLAKAREKARISLTKKKERNKKLKEQEKKLKELKLKEKEDQTKREGRPHSGRDEGLATGAIRRGDREAKTREGP
jgi:hypothetical protein